ncbi:MULTISPECIES: hypothetical protein [unclassified Mesorhizobium]|nr:MULTISPECIES: hypothetical protein [unclassified Mesorhizobium]
MADETETKTETLEVPAEVAPKAAPKKAKEAKLPANHELLLSGNILVSH